MSAVRPPAFDLDFPDSDGKPMSENTRQYEAIVTLKGNIEAFAPATAFVAGDHLIYVDARDPAKCQAPDVYVAFGRPRGHRGSYKLWDEENVFPQVVFEVLAPSNTGAEMRAKRAFYFAHGAEECYEFDSEAGTWTGFVRNAESGQPEPVAEMDDFVSPRLGMTFAFRPLELLVYRPDGSRFLSFQELNDLAESEAERADTERARAQAATAQAQAATAQADQLRAEVDRLRERLRAAGLDPDAP
jgi:Uma2 family endonuclease